MHTLELLREAKDILFPTMSAPVDTEMRRQLIPVAEPGAHPLLNGPTNWISSISASTRFPTTLHVADESLRARRDLLRANKTQIVDENRRLRSERCCERNRDLTTVTVYVASVLLIRLNYFRGSQQEH